MAALAYLFGPLSGLIAFLTGGTARMRFHGLQSIGLGLVWALALYLASAIAAVVTLVTFVLGGAVWLALLITSLLGRDLRLPGAAYLWTIASDTVGESDTA